VKALALFMTVEVAQDKPLSIMGSNSHFLESSCGFRIKFRHGGFSLDVEQVVVQCVQVALKLCILCNLLNATV
jgi:hypothetical protein